MSPILTYFIFIAHNDFPSGLWLESDIFHGTNVFISFAFCSLTFVKYEYYNTLTILLRLFPCIIHE